MPANVKLIVHKSIVDLRSEPQKPVRTDFSLNKHLLTQLLYNEELTLISQEGSWLFVNALEQEHFTTSWHPYQGWVHESEVKEVDRFPCLSHVVCKPTIHLTKKIPLLFGTKVALNEAPAHSIRLTKINRKTLLHDTEQFIGSPYLWGGRGSFNPQLFSSVDCSGFIDLLYRAQGICIPRDAEPQRKRCQKIDKKDLLPGDLIYLSLIQNPEKATHVILYNEDTFIEAPSTGNKVRKLSFAEHYIEKEGVVTLFGREGHYVPTFGRFFI